MEQMEGFVVDRKTVAFVLPTIASIWTAQPRITVEPNFQKMDAGCYLTGHGNCSRREHGAIHNTPSPS
jgi:hypothetical protein